MSLVSIVHHKRHPNKPSKPLPPADRIKIRKGVEEGLEFCKDTGYHEMSIVLSGDAEWKNTRVLSEIQTEQAFKVVSFDKDHIFIVTEPDADCLYIKLVGGRSPDSWFTTKMSAQLFESFGTESSFEDGNGIGMTQPTRSVPKNTPDPRKGRSIFSDSDSDFSPLVKVKFESTKQRTESDVESSFEDGNGLGMTQPTGYVPNNTPVPRPRTRAQKKADTDTDESFIPEDDDGDSD